MRTLLSKMQNAFLLCVCIAYSLVGGKANRGVAAPKKILILQMAKMGDMVCTTPMFRAAKEKYPAAKLYVVGNAINKEILRGNKDVDEYIVYDERDLWGLVLRLRREKIDFACQTAPNFGFLAALYLSGIPSIAVPKIENGYCPWETRSYKAMLPYVLTSPHRMESYAPREYLRLLEHVGIHTDATKKYVFPSEEGRRTVKEFYKTHNVDTENKLTIGVSVSVGNKIKNWPTAKWVEVIRYLVLEKNANVVLIGGERDREETEETLRLLPDGIIVIDTLGVFDIAGLIALIESLDAFIAVDTGPIYIAEALGIPTVDIIGPVDEREQPPVGTMHKIVKLDNIVPAVHIMNARFYDQKEARRQVEGIPVSSVNRAIDDILRELTVSK